MGSRLNVSSDRLVKPGIVLATPGSQGKRSFHYTMAASMDHEEKLGLFSLNNYISIFAFTNIKRDNYITDCVQLFSNITADVQFATKLWRDSELGKI